MRSGASALQRRRPYTPLPWRQGIRAALPEQITGAYDTEYRVVRSDGATRLVHDRAFPIRNAAGEDLGKIDEIMIDIPSGRVAYAVLSFGGFLGMGDKLFAIPWDALKVDEDQQCFILNVDRQTIEQAPGFDKDNWPDMGDQTWGNQLSNYYKVEPYWEGSSKTLSGGGGRY